MCSKVQTRSEPTFGQSGSPCRWKTCSHHSWVIHMELHSPSRPKNDNSSMGGPWEQKDRWTASRVWGSWGPPESLGLVAAEGARWGWRTRSDPRRSAHLPAEGSSRSAASLATESQTCSWEPRSPAGLSHRWACTGEWASPKRCRQAHTWSTGRTSTPASTVPSRAGRTGGPRAPHHPGCGSPWDWAWLFGCRRYLCIEVSKSAGKTHAAGPLVRRPPDVVLISQQQDTKPKKSPCFL